MVDKSFTVCYDGQQKENDMAISVKDIAWAAGFLEGEGCFASGKNVHKDRVPSVTAAQVDIEPLEKLQRILGGYIRPGSPVKNQSPYWNWGVYGRQAVGVMYTIYPLLSHRRQERIRVSVGWWSNRPVHVSLRRYCPTGHEYSDWNTYHAVAKEGAVRPHGTNNRMCRQCNRNRRIMTRALERWARNGWLDRSKAPLSLVVSGR